ncbi:MAG: glycosyltransferase family 2 protein [Oscillospiraceae bacterium]|nr:glycosyltransferase family 2 protein [Oscillospiraceae bacterium]
MSKKIAMLIPCYNEEKTIKQVVEDTKRIIPEADIYVYDNNSKDKTAEIAAAAGAIVIRERKQGKGFVVRSMFQDIDADAYIMVDGDDTYPLDNVPEMLKLVLEEKADMVVGDRLSSTYFTENKRRFHNSGNKIVRWLINKLFKSNVRDIMTGLRVFSKRFVKTFPVISNGFEIETEMTIHAVDKRLNVETVLVTYQDRPEGSESKLSTISDGTKVLRTIFRLYKNYRPLAFFGIISAALFVVALCFMIPVFITFWQTGEVPKVPTLIGSCFIMLMGVQSLFSGWILDVLVNQQRKDFEMRLIGH